MTTTGGTAKAHHHRRTNPRFLAPVAVVPLPPSGDEGRPARCFPPRGEVLCMSAQCTLAGGASTPAPRGTLANPVRTGPEPRSARAASQEGLGQVVPAAEG